MSNLNVSNITGAVINVTNVTATTMNAATMNVNSASVSQMNVTGTLLQLGSSNYPIVRGTNTATTSGTTKDFTGIPSWVKRITVILQGVSTSGGSQLLVQIGTGGTPTTSGYLSTSTAVITGSGAATNTTAGFAIYYDVNTYVVSCIMTIINISDNNWVAAVAGKGSTIYSVVGGGNVTLSGVLDMVSLTATNGTDTFDAGFMNIMYE